MKEKYLKSNKGITMVTLIVTIIILLILAGVTINNLNATKKVAPYNNMIADITLLEDKILVYYNKYNEIPKINDTSQIIEGEEYYKIDLNKLEKITLNYGIVKDGNELDVYLVNENLEVYYLKGVEKNGEIRHTDKD